METFRLRIRGPAPPTCLNQRIDIYTASVDSGATPAAFPLFQGIAAGSPPTAGSVASHERARRAGVLLLAPAAAASRRISPATAVS